MTQSERYWRLVAEKNDALARVREITEEINRLREKLNRANADYNQISDVTDAAYAALTEEERTEVKATNTWGN